MTTSISSPGTVPLTSVDAPRPSFDSMIDVWTDAIRTGGEDAIVGVIESMLDWATP